MAKYLIAAHPIQQKILEIAQGKNINELSLREIAKEIDEKKSPQQIQHHLTQMVKYGFLDIIKGKYRVGAILKKSCPNPKQN